MIPALLFFASLVNDVRGFIARHDLPAAERQLRAYQAQAGATPEFAAALSWLARGALDAKEYDRAQTLAAETRKVTLELLRTHGLDNDPWLPTALGASIEVQAQALAARGGRSEAIAFLREQAGLFGATSLGERIHKNINLLTLEGKPAPELEASQWLGGQRASLAGLRGHTVLLFFWAHWCGDCKPELPILANLQRMYGPQGLVIIGPTRLYGFIAGGLEAAPAVETQYVEAVRRQWYTGLERMPVPLGAANFEAYGASTIPTLVLIDASGIVRLYHPGAITEAELSTRILAVVRR